eukprot:scaffold69513_cov76-Cyclotella_meneghiniana.AAC.1
MRNTVTKTAPESRNWLVILAHMNIARYIHTTAMTANGSSGVKLSTLLQKHLGLSRRQSERMILTERITLYGRTVKDPTFEVPPHENKGNNNQVAIKVDGRLIQGVGDTLRLLQKEIEQTQTNSNDVDTTGTHKNTPTKQHSNTINTNSTTKELSHRKTRVWLCNKLKGELITEDDPDGRPSMIQRLIRGGVGEQHDKNKIKIHLKPVGRLDMMTEGLMIVTNDGQYARSLELPVNSLWRTYRVRVHGRLTLGKLNAMRRGVTVKLDNDATTKREEEKHASGEVVHTVGKTMRYKGIKVSVERKSVQSRNKRRGRGIVGQSSSHSGGTNAWLQITCTEGKNRMLRRILSSMGLDVTRLIRISYGDYDLNTIPPGRAVEVPCKSLEKMRKKGPVFANDRDENNGSEKSSKVENNRRGKRYNDPTTSDSEAQTNRVEWISYS